MKKILILVGVASCLLFLVTCVNKPTGEQENKYRFAINGVLVKDMNYRWDIAYFVIQRDSLPFDSAVVIVEDDTLYSYGNGEYSLAASFSTFHPKDTLNVVISCASDSFTFSKKIVMPDTFHIIDIVPKRQNPGGETRYIYWTASQYASGYFVIVSHPPAVGHNALVSYNYTQETIDRAAFRTSQGDLDTGTYLVYVVSYRETFLLYDTNFDLPDGLPEGNLDGAIGTIGAGVIAPRDSIEVTSL